MSSSVESTFAGQPEPNPLVEPTEFDPEKTVIRQVEILRESAMQTRPVSLVGFRQTASQLISQQLDHFLIESLVGTGGMGAVFRGRDTKLDREVAIKVVPIADRGAEAMRRFRVEAQSAAKLDHPNIARVYYVGETEYWSYIVFEFVEGTNLRELVVKKGHLSIDDAVCLTRQVAEALQHAYERKVVHRDIKPSNILVTQSGQAKLVDMGLARTTELDKSTNDLTASGVTLGTFDYISPEQAQDPRQADVRSDIYSLGCTLYFLLTAQPPFPDGTAIQKLLLHGTKMPEDPRLFRSDISDSMIAILRKMLAKKPSDRYQEPMDLIHDLRTLAELEGLVWASSSDNTANLPAAAQRTWLEATLPLLISIAAILGSTLWLQSNSYLSATFPIPRVDFPDVTSQPTDAFTNPEVTETGSKDRNSGATHEATNKPKVAIETSFPQSQSHKASSAADDQWDKDTVVVDPESANERDKNPLIVRSIEQAIELAAEQPQITRILVKAPSLFTSLASLKATFAVHTNLTIQSDTGQRCQWNIDSSDSPVDQVTSLAWIECVSNQLTLQDLDVSWRASSLTRRRSLFSVRPNAGLQLKNCTFTVLYDPNPYSISLDPSISLQGTALPSLIAIDSGLQESFGDSFSNNASKMPARIGCHQVSIRGQCDWLRMPSPIRTTVQMGNCWLAIAGSMFEMNGSRNAIRTGTPLRMDFQNVTSYAQRSWMRVVLSNSQPFPIPIVRTANECIFAGSKSHIEWNAIECDDWDIWDQSDEGKRLLRWIDLRGKDNVYDASTLSDYLTVKMQNSILKQMELGSDTNLIDGERGLETDSLWRKRPVLEPNRIHETTFEALEWNRSSYHPGFQPQAQ